MITIEQMVQCEVLCCMSSLVSTLAQSQGALERNGKPSHYARELLLLQEQAAELVAPVLDYGEAIDQAGFTRTRHGQCIDLENRLYANSQAACDANNLDPYEWEVYEHWAVSQWLADKLIAQGERVDTDFGALNIWARTTTGQAISIDGCIERIYAGMLRPDATDDEAAAWCSSR